MELSERLTVLKSDLQRANSEQLDNYLTVLLKKAESYINDVKGIKDDGSVLYDMCIIDLASFYFRKRADLTAEMPKFITHEINSLLFTQKSVSNTGGGDCDVV